MEASEVRDSHNSLWSPPSPISLSSQHLSFTYLSIWSNLGHRQLKLLRSIWMNAVSPNKYPQENPPKARWIHSNHFRGQKKKKTRLESLDPVVLIKPFTLVCKFCPQAKPANISGWISVLPGFYSCVLWKGNGLSDNPITHLPLFCL